MDSWEMPQARVFPERLHPAPFELAPGFLRTPFNTSHPTRIPRVAPRRRTIHQINLEVSANIVVCVTATQEASPSSRVMLKNRRMGSSSIARLKLIR